MTAWGAAPLHTCQRDIATWNPGLEIQLFCILFRRSRGPAPERRVLHMGTEARRSRGSVYSSLLLFMRFSCLRALWMDLEIILRFACAAFFADTSDSACMAR